MILPSVTPLVAPPPPRGVAPTLCDFASVHFWEDRYATTPTSRDEWLVPYKGALAALLSAELGEFREAPILELGCGSSRLSEEMAADGWSCLTASDISPTAVESARSRAAAAAAAGAGGGAAASFCVADARELSLAFGEGSFAGVVDKGTVDAICTGDGWDYEARRVSRSLRRVLKPGGKWVGVCLTPPSALLAAMESDQWATLSGERWATSGGSVLYSYVGQTHY